MCGMTVTDSMIKYEPPLEEMDEETERLTIEVEEHGGVLNGTATRRRMDFRLEDGQMIFSKGEVLLGNPDGLHFAFPILPWEKTITLSRAPGRAGRKIFNSRRFGKVRWYKPHPIDYRTTDHRLYMAMGMDREGKQQLITVAERDDVELWTLVEDIQLHDDHSEFAESIRQRIRKLVDEGTLNTSLLDGVEILENCVGIHPSIAREVLYPPEGEQPRPDTPTVVDDACALGMQLRYEAALLLHMVKLGREAHKQLRRMHIPQKHLERAWKMIHTRETIPEL